MISVALVLLVRSSTGSYLPAGLTAAGYGLGSACAAPLTGRGVDRHGQRALLLGLVGVFAGALTALVLCAGHVPVAVTIALAALTGVSRPPLESAMRALWPRVLDVGSLSLAYTIDAAGQDLVWIGGPLLLSGLLILDGPRAALLGCAAASVLGTILYVKAPATGARVTTPRTPSAHLGALLSRPLLALLAAAAFYGVAMGAYEISLTAFCARHHDRAAVGILLAIWSAGSIAGALISTTRPHAPDGHRRVLVLLSVLAGLLAVLQAAPDIPTLAPLIFIMGLPTAPFTAALSTAIERLAPHARTVEAFTWMTAAIATGIALGNATAGPLLTAYPHLGFLYAAAAAITGTSVSVKLASAPNPQASSPE